MDSGIQQLGAMIRDSKSPIIMIANDIDDEKLRVVWGLCLEIKFEKPAPYAIMNIVK